MRRPQPTPQRSGTRSSFVTRPTGARIDQDDREQLALDAFRDEALLADLDASLQITAVRAGKQHVLSVDEFRDSDPLSLHDTRRPASYTQRVHRVTLVNVRGSEPHLAWAESLGERAVMFDLLLGPARRRLVTQAVLLTWSVSGLTVNHFPDIYWWDETHATGGGPCPDRGLIDVTSGRPLAPSQTLAWELTARLCARLQWQYDVRLPPSRQRVANLGALDQAVDVDPETARLADNMDRGIGAEGASVARVLSRHVSTGPSPFLALRHLIATGRLFLDLDDPIRASTWLSRESAATSRPVPTVDRSAWPLAHVDPKYHLQSSLREQVVSAGVHPHGA